MKKFILQIKLFLIVLVILSPGTIFIQWQKNTELDLAGYKIYWGTQPQKYTNVKNVGQDTSVTIVHLRTGHYYFAVTAYDTVGNESNYSEETVVTVENGEDYSVNVKETGCYNYPNPFQAGKEVTHLRYYLKSDQLVTIDIYDVNEKLVRNLLSPTIRSQGEHTEDVWDGKSSFGYFMPNGIYYAIIHFGHEKKVITIGIVR